MVRRLRLRPNDLLVDPASIHRLPAVVQAQLAHAFTGALDTVFVAALPVAAAGFLLAWALPEVPLRTS